MANYNDTFKNNLSKPPFGLVSLAGGSPSQKRRSKLQELVKKAAPKALNERSGSMPAYNGISKPTKI